MYTILLLYRLLRGHVLLLGREHTYTYNNETSVAAIAAGRVGRGWRLRAGTTIYLSVGGRGGGGSEKKHRTRLLADRIKTRGNRQMSLGQSPAGPARGAREELRPWEFSLSLPPTRPSHRRSLSLTPCTSGARLPAARHVSAAVVAEATRLRRT